MPRAPEPEGDGPSAAPLSLEKATAAEVLSAYLHAQAAGFLRGLRLRGEHEGSAEAAHAAEGAVRRLRGAARRLGGSLHTYRHLLDTAWADQLRTELSWLSGTLAREYAYAGRLERLLGALHRLASDESGAREGAGAGTAAGSGSRGSAGKGGGAGVPEDGAPAPQDTPLAMGAARAGALLERQLTLARTRAHTAALQALVSSRFHAVADAVALLASEAPLFTEAADGPAAPTLLPLAGQARRRVSDAVAALPLSRQHGGGAGGAGAGWANGSVDVVSPRSPLTAEVRQDAAWHQVRLLLRVHRYAEEVLLCGVREDEREGTEWPQRPGGPLGAGPGGQQDGPGGAGEAPSAGAQAGPLAGPPAGSSAARLVSASAALDRHRDAAEAAAAAASAARTPRIAPSTAYALGVLHADQRHEVAAARQAFGRLWRPAGS